MAKLIRILLLLGLTGLSTVTMLGQSNSSSHENWVAVWATSEEMAITVPDRPVLPPDIKMPSPQNNGQPRRPTPYIPADVENQTVRIVIHTSVGGKRLRIELSNAFGRSSVSIGSAHIAIRSTGSSINSSSDRLVTFSGNQSVDVRPGIVIVSDPVDLEIKPLSDLAISLFVVKAAGTPTNHALGLHTAYISSGNTVASESMPEPKTSPAYLWLRSVDVAAAPGDFAIACLGDSITDGFRTTVDADQAWPTLLAKRLSENKKGPRIAVLNEGISGNQVLRDGAGVSALARFDRDVLSEPGVRWIVLLEGINDINIHGQITGPGALSAQDLIQGYKRLVAHTHMYNIKIMGATLTPDKGVWLAGPVGEATRQKVNQWIKTGGDFDAVVDLDAATRDRDDPTLMLPAFDSSDHIHPNDPGNAAMANAFDLAVFMK
jgi:lysophospholipase L1-like esterase